jgi:hypothetical protein
MKNPELQHVTTDELMKELLERCPVVVVAACVPDRDGKPMTETTTVTGGNRASQLGLATLLRREIFRKLTCDRVHRPLE